MDNQYYFKTLHNIDTLLQESKNRALDPQKEMIVIKALSFYALLKNGCAYTIDQHWSTEKKKTGKIQQMIFEETSTLPEHTEDPGVVIKDPDTNESHECKLDELKAIMHEDFDKLIHDDMAEMQPETTDLNTSITEQAKIPTVDMPAETPKSEPEHTEDTDLPDFTEHAEEPAPAPVKDVEPAATPKVLSTPESPQEVYHFTYESQYPDDPKDQKAIASFLYDWHKVRIVTKGSVETYNIYVYPLEISENALITKVFVVAEYKGSIRAGISKGKSLAVELPYNDRNFMIRGSFKDGVFASQVNLISGDNVNMMDDVFHGDRSVKTSTTYVHLPIGENGSLNIFPGKFNDNESNGLALAAILIVNGDGDTTILAPTADGNFVLTGQNGDNLKIEVFYMGDNLCYLIE
jgi:hypothetical protein